MEIVYKIYYRIFWCFFSFWTINFPTTVKVPENIKPLTLSIKFDHGKKKHSYFLLPKESINENKWLFWKRKFAYSFDGKKYYKLSSLTIWPDGNFGLNHSLISRCKSITPKIEKIKFVTWK